MKARILSDSYNFFPFTDEIVVSLFGSHESFTKCCAPFLRAL